MVKVGKISRLMEPVYIFKTKVAFLEGRLLSSQSKQLKKYTKSSD